MPWNLPALTQTTMGYHGTGLEEAKEITRDKFKLTPPDQGAFLGEGVYFFDNQPSQAKRWAQLHHKRKAVAVIESTILYGRLLNLTDAEQLKIVHWFAEEFRRKAHVNATLPTIIDIVAEELNVDVVKATRIPRNPSLLMATTFSADVEIILAVRNTTNILTKEITWSAMASPA
jgi:hypothetical protein